MKNYLINFLVDNYFIFMRFILLLCSVAFLATFEKILRLLRGISKKTWLMLFLVVLLGLIMRIWRVPHVHHVYFDEFFQINIAENLSYQGKSLVTLKGTNSICEISTFNFWPGTYHTLLAMVFSIFGDSEFVAYNLSVVIGSVSVVIISLMVFFLFNNSTIALYCAFLFNLIPVHLKYSGASELGIVS